MRLEPLEAEHFDKRWEAGNDGSPWNLWRRGGMGSEEWGQALVRPALIAFIGVVLFDYS